MRNIRDLVNNAEINKPVVCFPEEFLVLLNSRADVQYVNRPFSNRFIHEVVYDGYRFVTETHHLIPAYYQYVNTPK